MLCVVFPMAHGGRAWAAEHRTPRWVSTWAGPDFNLTARGWALRREAGVWGQLEAGGEEGQGRANHPGQGLGHSLHLLSVHPVPGAIQSSVSLP